ncbi:MAG: thiamine phosphate synthase [Puniceicoccaceae bacterium]|nr:MAG: thiamine phosphate synthase [Puniceicoccaceae bacterium]
MADPSAPATVARARFYALLDTGYTDPGSNSWETTCQALLRGGAGLIQLRAKSESPAERRRLLERILPFFEPGRIVPRPPPLIVNDDLGLACAFPNLGLHVGQDDIPPEEARRSLGPGRILGLSTHSLDQARAALALPPGTLDYFAVGPVFPTATKPDYPSVGLDLVRRVAALQPTLPFFCIGGITLENAPEVIRAGARGLVAVSTVLQAPDPAAVVAAFNQLHP